MAGKKGPRKSKKQETKCKALDLDVAYWMIPERISVKKESTCNVLIIVPHGYPGEDDNTELLGAWLAQMLSCFAVINNRLYHRKASKGLAGKKGDLGNSTFAKKVPEFMDSIVNSLKSMNSTHHKIVVVLHGMEDDAADEFHCGLSFALCKGNKAEKVENECICLSEDFALEFLSGLKQLAIAVDDYEPFCFKDSLALELFNEYGAQVFNVFVRYGCHRNTTQTLRQTCLGLVKVIKGLSIFHQLPDGREIRIDNEGNGVSQEAEISDDRNVVSVKGKEYEVCGNYTPSEPVEGPSIRDKVNSLRDKQLPNMETYMGKAKEADMVDDNAVEGETEAQNEAGEASAVVGEDQLANVISRIKGQDKIKNDKGELIEFAGDVRNTFVADVRKSYPVVKAMVTNIFDTGKFFHEVRERQKKNRLWITFLDTIGMSRRTAQNYIQAYERLGTSMSDYSYLGVTKLLTVTRVKEPVAYLEKHADEIAQESTVQVRQRVAQETKRNTSGQKRKKPTEKVEEMGYQNVKAALAPNGRVLKLMGLNKELQEEILKLVKSHFSKKK